MYYMIFGIGEATPPPLTVYRTVLVFCCSEVEHCFVVFTDIRVEIYLLLWTSALVQMRNTEVAVIYNYNLHIYSSDKRNSILADLPIITLVCTQWDYHYSSKWQQCPPWLFVIYLYLWISDRVPDSMSIIILCCFLIVWSLLFIITTSV